MSDEDDVRAASQQFYAALNRVFNGDTTPMSEIWLHSPTVTALRPDGGREVGWAELSACMLLTMHRSSATSDKCGNNSHIQMPFSPWRWNLNLDGATNCVLPLVIAVTRCPMLMLSGSGCLNNLPKSGL